MQTPTRIPRESIGDADLERLIAWFRDKSFDETADMAIVLAATGLRIREELLRPGAILRVEPADSYDVVHVCGKGRRLKRTILVDVPEARMILASGERMESLRKTPYITHRWRWRAAGTALGITATLRAVRHRCASKWFAASGGNGEMVQESLGHANLKTTADYLGVRLVKTGGRAERSVEAKERAKAKTKARRAAKRVAKMALKGS